MRFEHILPKLATCGRIRQVAVHPVCSAVKMGLTRKLTQVMRACSEELLEPRDGECCAFAGDRRLLFPELTRLLQSQRPVRSVNNRAMHTFQAAERARSP